MCVCDREEAKSICRANSRSLRLHKSFELAERRGPSRVAGILMNVLAWKVLSSRAYGVISCKCASRGRLPLGSEAIEQLPRIAVMVSKSLLV